MIRGFFGSLFGGGWDLSSIDPPWGERPSIHAHITSHLGPGSGLAEGGEILPDDAEVYPPGALRWVAGGMDGALAHHAGGGASEEVAKEVEAALQATLRDLSQDNVDRLYEALKRHRAIGYVDLLVERIASAGRLDPVYLHDLMVWLATSAADREPVKVALALLGILRGFDDRELLLTLGRHEEFTLFAAVALANCAPEPETDLWALARNVEGWGRIHVVERLADTEDPTIKRWLLLEGYQNTVMVEYLAHTCAVAGELHLVLRADRIEPPLLRAAGELIQALIRGGPAAGIDDYDHGAEVVERFLVHAGGRMDDLAHFLVLESIQGFLSEADGWEDREGWTEERRRGLLARIEAMVGDPRWRSLAESGLQSDDMETFGEAAEAAEHLGIDVWEHWFARLEQGGFHWYQVAQTGDRDRFERVVALAEQRLPLGEIAGGPAEDLGLGPEYQDHSALDAVLQGLQRFPGLGWRLVETGMQSPVVRNRHLAIHALTAWEQGTWPEGARTRVEGFRDAEPDAEVRQAFDGLLAAAPEV